MQRSIVLSWIRLPNLSPLVRGQRPHWLSPDVILFLFLPALVFEGSLKLQVRDLWHDAASLLLLANLGVLVAACVTGYLVYWATHLPLLIAFLFGAIISATWLDSTRDDEQRHGRARLGACCKKLNRQDSVGERETTAHPDEKESL